jgi:hypothetical protein
MFAALSGFGIINLSCLLIRRRQAQCLTTLMIQIYEKKTNGWSSGLSPDD